MSVRALVRAAALLGIVLLSGCALTSKSAPLEIRYFSPEALGARQGGGFGRPVAANSPRLRLGRVASSAHLGSKIVYRRSEVEVGTYDERRWTENPDVYVRRSLARALFEERALAEAMGSAAPTLDVELVTFEEVHRGAARSGRVEIDYVLHDERDVLAAGRVSVERPATTASTEEVVVAIAGALHEATSVLAEAVAAKLGENARAAPAD